MVIEKSRASLHDYTTKYARQSRRVASGGEIC